MLNDTLAFLALVTWGTSYTWFFRRDIRRWWWRRQYRHMLTAWEKARYDEEVSAWMRRPAPPPRARPASPPPRGLVMLPAPAKPQPKARPSAQVIAFPKRRR